MEWQAVVLAKPAKKIFFKKNPRKPTDEPYNRPHFALQFPENRPQQDIIDRFLPFDPFEGGRFRWSVILWW